MLSVNGAVPDWVTVAFALGIFVVGPLYAWLIELPASVKDREERTRPRYHYRDL